MGSLLPGFIVDNYKSHNYTGNFTAYTMFIDISGFTEITRELMQHSKEGAEILSRVINDIFAPSIQAVYENRGFVSSFAGDAFTAIFQAEEAEYALRSAFSIISLFHQKRKVKTKFGNFNLNVKIGLSYGKTEFFIIDSDIQNSFFFKGEAIYNCTICQKKANKMQIIADISFVNNLNSTVNKEKTGENWYRIYPGKIVQGPHKADIKKYKADYDEVIQRFFPVNITGQEHLGEFRQIISCFIGFSDKAGFMDQLRDIIESCHRHGGFFNKVDFGDKGAIVLVIFGAPRGFEKLGRRACDFALSLRAIPGLCFRAGLASGISFAGIVGSDLRKEYTALGDVVNLSSRLMMKAEWGQILAGPEFQRSLFASYTFSPSGPVYLKGFENITGVWELNSKIARKYQLSFTGKFIGRSNETARLKLLISPIFNNKFGGIIYIDGAAGSGKSRFIMNFKNIMSSAECDFIYLSCDEVLSKAFNPFETFFKGHFDQLESGPIEKRKQKFDMLYKNILARTENKEIKSELTRTSSIIGALAGLEWDNSLYSRLDPRGRYENTLYAVKNFFKALCKHRPLIIVVEDANYIDSESIELLKTLVYNVDDFPFIILALCRPEDDGSKFSFFDDLNTRTERLELRTFDRRVFSKLLFEKLQVKNGIVPDDTEEYLWKKSGGNPFFLEQMALHLRENNYLDEDFNLTSSVTEIPSGINQIIIARIDRLSFKLKETIKTAAVLGREFALSILRKILSFKNITDSEEEFLKYINDGDREQIWEYLTEMSYIFKHALIRDAIYDIQLKDSLRHLHGIAGDIIESLYHNNLEDHFEELADHYQKADNSEKAVIYMLKAADQAKGKYQNKKAIALYDRLQKFYNKERDIKELIHLLQKKADIMELMGNWQNAEKCYSKALELSNSKNFNNLSVDSMNSLGALLQNMGRPQDALSILKKSLKMAENDHYDAGISNASGIIGLIHTFQGEYESAMHYFERKLSICRKNNDKKGISHVTGHIGLVYAGRGNAAKAMEFYQKKLEISREIEDKRGISYTLGNMGIIYAEQGDLIMAMRSYNDSLEICKEIGDKRGISYTYGNIGSIYADRGDYDKAMESWEKQLSICKEIGDKRGINNAVGNMGYIYSIRGNYSEAMRCCEIKLSICKELGDKLGISYAVGNMGEVYKNMGDLEKALSCYQDQLSMSEEIGDKRGACFAIGSMAKIYHELADLDKAIKNYDKAIELSSEIDSKYHLTENLFHKAEFLYEKGDRTEASAVNQKAYEISHEINRADMVFNTTFFKYKLENNHREMERLLHEDGRTKQQIAAVYFELWKMTGSEKYKQKAVDIYNGLINETPNHEFIKRLNALNE